MSDHEWARWAGLKEFYCKPCNGTGVVVVPHIAKVSDGKWDGRYTMAVTCGCDKGKMVYQAWQKSSDDSKAKFTFLTLEEYEFRNPDWMEQMAAKLERHLALPSHASLD